MFRSSRIDTGIRGEWMERKGREWGTRRERERDTYSEKNPQAVDGMDGGRSFHEHVVVFSL